MAPAVTFLVEIVLVADQYLQNKTKVVIDPAVVHTEAEPIELVVMDDLASVALRSLPVFALLPLCAAVTFAFLALRVSTA